MKMISSNTRLLVSLVSLRSLVSLVPLVSLVLLGACTTQEETTPAEAEHHHVTTLTIAQESSIGLETGIIEQRMMGASIRVNGMLDVPPQYLLSITAPFGGRVISTEILPGTHVRKGQKLIVLEDAEFISMQQDYLTVSAELTFAEQELKRQQDLATDNVSARRNLEQAQANATVLRVRKRALAEQLALIGIDARTLTAENLSRRITVTAPFDGYVTRVDVNTGSAVAPNGTLLELVDPTHLHVELAVFESDAARLKAEQEITVMISGEDTTRSGHIHLVGTKIKSDRTVDVHAHLDTPDGHLLPGTTLMARIHIEDSLHYAVPTDAIVTADGGTWLFVKTGEHTYERVSAVVGEEEDQYSEILNGEAFVGKQIVISGGHRMIAPGGEGH